MALSRLDAVPAAGELAAYEDALQTAFAGQAPVAPAAPEGGGPRVWHSRVVLWGIPRLRYLVWLVVVFATAYTMFYANRCSFGTLIDYLTVFLWALGLTQAGFAVIGEARSSYAPPAGS